VDGAAELITKALSLKNSYSPGVNVRYDVPPAAHPTEEPEAFSDPSSSITRPALWTRWNRMKGWWDRKRRRHDQVSEQYKTLNGAEKWHTLLAIYSQLGFSKEIQDLAGTIPSLDIDAVTFARFAYASLIRTGATVSRATSFVNVVQLHHPVQSN
jgi:hypothetical protein